jgi:hypothetical protein
MIKDNSLLFVPDPDRFEEIEEDAWKKAYKELKKNGRQYQEIFGMDSQEMFAIMENFANTVTDRSLRSSLILALSGKKPFRAFNALIHPSAAREAWFCFRDQSCLAFITAQLTIDAGESKV